SEFMDVNYGEQLKRYLLDRVSLIRIHRFDPNHVQFDDALVSSAVVWFRKASRRTDHLVDFTYGGTLAEPHRSQRVSLETLRKATKWTRFPSTSDEKTIGHQRLTLSDLFKIQRGLVTGSNEFFVLKPQQIEKYQLPSEFLTPILPSPRYLPYDEIQADSIGEPT